MNVRFSFDFKELSSALILIFSYLKGGEGMGLHAPPPPPWIRHCDVITSNMDRHVSFKRLDTRYVYVTG